MLGKLISYEIRGLWKPTVIIFAIMVVAGVAGVFSFSTFYAMDSTSVYLSDSEAALISGLMIFAIFSIMVVAVCAWAIIIVTIVRFYRTMFTDQGYLTLTLPVSTAKLVLAKFLVAFVASLVASFVAFAFPAAMRGIFLEEGLGTVLAQLLTLASWNGEFFDAPTVGSVATGVFFSMLNEAYLIALAYLSLTLGAWWSKRHKVAVAIAIYIGISWGVSFVSALCMTLPLAMSESYFATTQLMSASYSLQMVCYAIIAVAAVALSIFLVRRKVDLS